MVQWLATVNCMVEATVRILVWLEFFSCFPVVFMMGGVDWAVYVLGRLNTNKAHNK
jgi:hypothetical protein